MTCRDHATPVEDCCGCHGWDPAMAERAITTYGIDGVAAATIRAAVAERLSHETTERMRAAAHDEGVRLTLQRYSDLAEAAATYEAMRAELEVLRCGDLVPYFDGQLRTERRDAFDKHLATCEKCAAGLLGLMHEDNALSDAVDRRQAVFDAAVAWARAGGTLAELAAAVTALEDGNG